MENDNLREFSILLEAGELEIADWLLFSLKKKSLSPLIFADEPSILIQVRNLFFELPLLDQTKFRRIIIGSMQKWHPINHGISTFEDLVLLCAYTRTFDALALIIKRIEEFSDNVETDEYDDALGILFGVLAGFAPDKRVLEVLQKLFYSPHIKYKYLAQIFIGLCTCKPVEYTNYIPRMLNTFMMHSSYFRIEYIMAMFVESVGLKIIADNFFSIQESYKEYFLDLLCRKQMSPVKIVLTKEEGWCLKSRSDYESLGTKYSRDTQLYPLFFSIKKNTEIRKLIDDGIGLFNAKLSEISIGAVEYAGVLL